MNPYQLIEDLKAAGLFTPLLVKSFSIEGSVRDGDQWIATVKTSFGPLYIREGSLGYSEVSIPILSVKVGDEAFLSALLKKLSGAHKECMGHISIEEGSSIFYHLPIVNSYTEEILKEFVTTICEEADLLSSYVTSLSSLDDHVNLDNLGSMIDDLMDEDETDDIDEDDN